MTKTPESLTAAGRAAQLGVCAPGSGEVRGSNKPTVHEMRARLSLSVAKPASASSELNVGDEFDGSQMTLPSLAIRPYEKNPRTRENPKYASIKESIRAQGVTNQISVTRRPGQAHYIPYAGGNTRLQIVHELLEETQESRWQSMTVTYRAWRGEAATIAAHLAENEQRGDTSYWEKAQGLWSLKAELEAETQRIFAAGELTKEAKRLGMDFGLNAVLCLLFAVEHLSAVGPWLRADMVKSTLKPAISALIGLCDTFNVSREFKTALEEAVHAASDDLRSREQEEHSEVVLDASALITSLGATVSTMLHVSPKQLPLILSVRAANPRTSAEELRKIGSAPSADAVIHSTPPQEAVSTTGVAKHDSTSEGLAPLQLPLAPAMLAQVRSPESSAHRPTEDGAEGQRPDATDPKHAPSTIHDVLCDITRLAELGDVVCVCEAMPLGYYVEMPEGGMAAIEGASPVDIPMRKAAWHVLASLSGQFDERLASRLPTASKWRRLSEGQGTSPFSDEYESLAMGVTRSGACHLAVVDVHDFFWHPRLGELFLQLWSWALHWRQAEPQRFLARLQPFNVDLYDNQSRE